MIKLYIQGQALKIYSPVIAADSLRYLEVQCHFDESWNDASKWVHFRQEREGAAIVYDFNLNEADRVEASAELNLTVGEWETYITGTIGESRLTTVPIIITVKASGLIDAPLHQIPLTVAEQIDVKASTALSDAKTVLTMAENGEFDGRDGTSLAPIGHFNTLNELKNIITEKKPGDVYTVGYEPPYDLYTWDGINFQWRNQGQLQGAPGEEGKPGVTFTPNVDQSGNLSWSNDGGLPNPPMRNIQGEQGKPGTVGPAGPGAYEKAKEAGYTGTEETFYAALTYMPYHHTRHEAGGADPITIAVTSGMVVDDSRTQYFPVTLTIEGWTGDAAPFTQTVADVKSENDIAITENDKPKVYFLPPETFGDLEAAEEAYGLLYHVVSGNGTVTFKAKEKPAVAINVALEVNRI